MTRKAMIFLIGVALMVLFVEQGVRGSGVLLKGPRAAGVVAD